MFLVRTGCYPRAPLIRRSFLPQCRTTVANRRYDLFFAPPLSRFAVSYLGGGPPSCSSRLRQAQATVQRPGDPHVIWVVVRIDGAHASRTDKSISCSDQVDLTPAVAHLLWPSPPVVMARRHRLLRKLGEGSIQHHDI
ncbi:MAG: hypothetical protein AAGF95_16335 [Chloroflexota bacterium]